MMKQTMLATATVATGLMMAAVVQAQPMTTYGYSNYGTPATVTTRTVTTVTTQHAAPQDSYVGTSTGGREGEVVYQGQPGSPPPGPREGEMFYPETHVWQADPHEFPRDWAQRHHRAPVRRAHAATRSPRLTMQQTRVASHPRRDYVQVRDDSGRPVPVMVQVATPDGYRETVPAVIRPSAVPTVVRATGGNPPPVMYQVHSQGQSFDDGREPMPMAGERINWAQERQQGMPQSQWHDDHGDDRWHDMPPPPPPGNGWDR